MNAKSAKIGTILVVDDNPTNLEVLFEYFGKADFKVLAAKSGESAIQRAHYTQPDIILLDVMMPGLDGFETCRLLKEDPLTKDIPVIFITALNSVEDKIKGFEVGAVDYVTKPIQFQEVVARVTTHLTIQKLQKNLIEQNEKMQKEIATRKRAEQQLYHRAFHDVLTGLPNRALFMNSLEGSIERSEQLEEGEKYLFAALFLDLDRFKLVNDSMGHLVGDQLLITVARRLEACVRPNDTVARLGGDEFAILLDDINDIDEAVAIADKIQKELSQPINLNGREVFTTTSIGITTSTHQYARPEDLLRDADTAMYHAKAGGRARHELFARDLHAQAVAKLGQETDLRQAMRRQEFLLYYQPIISLTSGQITCVEALLRWHHPDHGLILPQQFIPMLEETGLIIPVGEWVIQTACFQTKLWHQAGYDFLHLAVNVSALQFQQQNIPQVVKKILAETGLPPEALELEVTEVPPLDPEFDLTALNELQTMGVQLSIDDFGLGSSLQHLKQLPVNTLKIDQSFVRDITPGGEDAAMITAMISMAHSLKLKVIAEGVETEDQLFFLQAQQCNEIQGYLFSRPLPTQELTALLQSGRSLALNTLDDALEALVYAEAARRQKIGFALVNSDLEILTTNVAMQQWVEEDFTDITNQYLPDVFTELIGFEDTLKHLTTEKGEGFTIPKIHRPETLGPGRYFNLQIEPFLENDSNLLIIATDVTEEALREWRLRQELSELKLQEKPIT